MKILLFIKLTLAIVTQLEVNICIVAKFISD